MLNRGPISWCSKRQVIVTLFLMEVEYIALALAIKKATRFCLLLTKLGFLQTHDQNVKIFIKENNASTETLLSDIIIWRKRKAI